jgi:ribonuclease BN (tRNA processing enzyme)
VQLTFIGTRGYIAATKRSHRYHTATLVEHRQGRVMLDCGADWRRRVHAVDPHAVVITHAHPDHAGGISASVSCPVYATRESWELLRGAGLAARQRRVVEPWRPFRLFGMTFEAVPVVHSLRAPAVGYRIRAGKVRVFYVPDVLELPGRPGVLAGITLYIGDGAAITRPIVRRARDDGETRIGHTSIRAQLDWCQEAGVRNMIVTHCGSEIVRSDDRSVAARLRALGRARGVSVELARDGWTRSVA